MKKLLLLTAIICMVPMAQAIWGIEQAVKPVLSGGSKAALAAGYKAKRTEFTNELDAVKKKIADLDKWYNALPA